MDDDIEKKVRKGIEANKRWVVFWLVVLGIIVLIMGWVAVSQQRSDTNEGPKTTQVKSLTCEAEDYLYPFFKFDNSDKKEIKIIVSFMGEGVRSISLQQMLYYSDIDLASRSESENHAAMNNTFGQDGMTVDALDATYSVMSNGMRFSIYGVFDKMKAGEMRYFLLDNLEGYDYNKIREAYDKVGLICGSD